jgi:hypothetical protein
VLQSKGLDYSLRKAVMLWSDCLRQQTSLAIAALLLLFLGHIDTVQGDTLSRDGKYFKFASRPDIQAPVWDISSNNDTLVAPGYWFIAPYEIVTQTGKFMWIQSFCKTCSVVFNLIQDIG